MAMNTPSRTTNGRWWSLSTIVSTGAMSSESITLPMTCGIVRTRSILAPMRTSWSFPTKTKMKGQGAIAIPTGMPGYLVSFMLKFGMLGQAQSQPILGKSSFSGSAGSVETYPSKPDLRPSAFIVWVLCQRRLAALKRLGFLIPKRSFEGSTLSLHSHLVIPPPSFHLQSLVSQARMTRIGFIIILPCK